MFLYLKPLSDFTVLQAVGYETDHIFLAPGQKGNALGIAQLKRVKSSQGLYEVLRVLAAGPDLPFVDRLNALSKRFQGMTSVEDASRTVAKSAYHLLWFGVPQEHDRGSSLRVPSLLKDPDTSLGAVLEFFADERDVGFVGVQLAYNLLRAAGQSVDREYFAPMSEGILQQFARHVVGCYNEH